MARPILSLVASRAGAWIDTPHAPASGTREERPPPRIDDNQHANSPLVTATSDRPHSSNEVLYAEIDARHKTHCADVMSDRDKDATVPPSYAHSVAERPTTEWEPLEVHLKAVASQAASFAERFSAKDWAALAGRWHDLGKYAEEFQQYLRKANGLEAHIEMTSRVDHSTAGAQHAHRTLVPLGRLIAYCIAGHHAGLPDATGGGAGSALDARLEKAIPDWSAAPADILKATTLEFPKLTFDSKDAKRASYQISLFCRFLFSALVDADFLATETFMSPERSQLRPAHRVNIATLKRTLDAHLNQMSTQLDTSVQSSTTVATCRKTVLEACRDAATDGTGLFSLMVPTGGGKTLSSLAFALDHAQTHGMDRVIYAIPFTSIVEQTADVFRNVFESLATYDDPVVLEHHSNLEPSHETAQSRLASENWDARLVVTTNVQFFESLFASRPSHCRKLHRLVNSVIILDEVQTLPVTLLKPCLAVLRELAADYHCSIVLCSATQPAVEWREGFQIGLRGVKPIIKEPQTLYTQMKRVTVESLGTLTDDVLCQRLSQDEQMLCIVNTRTHARNLFDQLSATSGPEGLFHLSTLMCGEHRRQTLRDIRERLDQHQPCRVISTQLIEAGVDVDFPTVYRALTGVDSIAQAAGRCNREGRQRNGRMFVFEPDNLRLQGWLASTESSTRELMPMFPDLLSIEAIEEYFRLQYWKHETQWDKKQIMDMFGHDPERFHFQFRSASSAFRMIEDEGVSVMVPWNDTAEHLIERLRQAERSRTLYRQLQRYFVRALPNMVRALGTDLEKFDDETVVLINTHCYDEHTGLRVDRAGTHEPNALIL